MTSKETHNIWTCKVLGHI